MKTNTDKYKLSNVIIKKIAFKAEELEQEISKEHLDIKNNVAIPLALSLAEKNKPEPETTSDVYTKLIYSAYSKMIPKLNKEIQSEIETFHIETEREEAQKQIDDNKRNLIQKETQKQIKKRELDQCDNSLLKKQTRYKWIRLFLFFLVLIDAAISGKALQAMGYNFITSSIIGFAIGIGVFLFAENLPEIINKGKSPLQKRLIGVGAFVFLFMVFYVLGIFRTTTFQKSIDYGEGIKPIYFAVLNLFFAIVAFLVNYFNALNKNERSIVDRYNITRDELKKIEKEIQTLKSLQEKIRVTQTESELVRKQIQIYARDMQELVQRLFEESQNAFYSTNCIHRSDGKVPKFFEYPMPKITNYSKLKS